MLRRPSPAVQLCDERAAECERLAQLAETIAKKDFYLSLATTWRTLGDQREFIARMDSMVSYLKG